MNQLGSARSTAFFNKILFLQSFQSPPLYAWVEDDRLLLDRGSLLPTMSQRLEAMAAFDADFTALLAEAL